MSDAATGQPVGAPADPPPPPTAAPEDLTPGRPARGAEPPEPEGRGTDGPVGPGTDGLTAPARAASPGAQGGGGQNRRRRGTRGGRGRSRTAGARGPAEAPPSDEPPLAVAPGATPAVSPGPAPPTPAGPDRPKIGDTRPARPVPANTGPAVVAPGGRNGGRSGGRGRSRPRSGGDPGANRPKNGSGRAKAPNPPSPDGGVPTGGRRGGRERRGKAVGRYMICVHVRPELTQIALLEGRTLVEHYISRASDDATQIDGNIYRGRVQNVLPGMEAAFVDIGTPKNAVLYHGDVRYDTEDVETTSAQPRIEQLLRPGQTILCQVTKNPIGAKGARLTQEVSLPGRFVVLVPNSTAYGISKRLEDGERRRLRRIVDAVRPEGHGLIVRTAAAGASAEELGNDVARLVEQWEAIAAASVKGQGPALLYREPAIAVRVIREELNREYRAVVIDDLDLYDQVREYVGAVNPELADRVEYFDPETEALPVFERYHVHEQLHRALDRKVYLPSGGSLVVDRTEALTVIDVNTGKNVGTTNLEETVFRNNLEAAEEVARQLRLRDIGGIIVIDFIDMEVRENRDKVGSALRSALARDKTRTQVFDISELGLVEMTRKRVSEGLIESMSTTCEVCGGRGIVFEDPEL
jgi:ribonuclease E